VQTAGPKEVTPLAQPPRIESFTAEPAVIAPNQAATLRWTVTGTNPEIVLDPGLGIVTPTGSRQVFPAATTTYTLTARSGVAADVRSVTVEVRTPPVPPKSPPARQATSVETLRSEAQDVYFDYDQSDLREDARQALNANAALLRRIFAADPDFTVVIEGHADERGSAEYNIGLGDRRATVTREFLVQLGVPANRLRTISFGEERPVCTDANEACYQRNRRAHLAPGQ
jgi:peptidoglycan-associated lipoprotein